MAVVGYVGTYGLGLSPLGLPLRYGLNNAIVYQGYANPILNTNYGYGYAPIIPAYGGLLLK
jgi:hypothetical protein